MVDAREKLSDVAFQNPRGLHVVARNDPGILFESVHGSVCALVEAAGVGVENECPIEAGI